MPREEWGLGLVAPACVSPETSAVRIILVWEARTCGGGRAWTEQVCSLGRVGAHGPSRGHL